MGKKKNFVLDTNVILHDYRCLSNFQENDIYLPIAVLEELDHFKKGNEQVNYNARAFVRELDALTTDELFTKGISLGAERGRLFILTGSMQAPKVEEAFKAKIPDHQILAAAEHLQALHSDIKTVLVSKDINLRMKGRSIGLTCEDYITDKVVPGRVEKKESQVFEGVEPKLIDRIYSIKEGVPADEFERVKELGVNECFVLKSDRNSVNARYASVSERIVKVGKDKSYGIEPRNAEQAFALSVLNDPDIKLVALTGKAGTGKTLLALAAALNNHADYRQILLARPIVALSNKDLGFLPGDAKEKVLPYMQPLFDNLNVIKAQFSESSGDYKRIDDLLKSEKLVIEALAFIRGRSLTQTYCIVDEAQNLTPAEIKTIITRAGEGTKMVFTGDIEQIDQPYLDSESNGLVYMIDRMKEQPLFAHIDLLKGERSELSELAGHLL